MSSSIALAKLLLRQQSMNQVERMGIIKNAKMAPKLQNDAIHLEKSLKKDTVQQGLRIRNTEPVTNMVASITKESKVVCFLFVSLCVICIYFMYNQSLFHIIHFLRISYLFAFIYFMVLK